MFAVKYVFSGSEALSLPSEVVGRGTDSDGAVYLHRLADPRPLALLYYEADVVDSDAWALELMDDPRYHLREKIVVQRPLSLELSGGPVAGSVDIRTFKPEDIVLQVDTPQNAILSLSLPHYPGLGCALKRRGSRDHARLRRAERGGDPRRATQAQAAIRADDLYCRLKPQSASPGWDYCYLA